jgi:phosphate transport system substrate-binding protein
MVSLMKTAVASLVVATLGGAFASVCAADININGAGATFPEPLYAQWVAEYHQAHPEVKVNYQGIGSGGGIKGITEKTLDFAGSDAPMNKKELDAVGGPAAILEFPSCAGGIVPAYNVPGVKGDLKFTGDLLAQIFLGKITNWNDPQIAKLNPDQKLPSLVIQPAWRNEGSGTTFVWTNYLVTQNKEFANTIGAAKLVKWPVGTGGQGNPGVAAIIEKVAGSIGYIEQSYAVQHKIDYGSIQNAAGEFVKASPETVSKAGESVADKLKGQQLTASIWNQTEKDAYPVSSFTYLIAYKDLNNIKSKEQAQSLVDFLWWVTHEGQSAAGPKGYAPLSGSVQKKVEEEIGSFTFQGAAIKPTNR